MRRIITIIMYLVLVFNLKAQLPGDSGKNTKELSEFNIAILGDSMSWMGGENCEKPQGWTHHFKNLLNPASIKMYARSGATWTNTPSTKENITGYTEIIDDDNVIYNEVKRLQYDLESETVVSPDLIIIYAGANDAWFDHLRPGCLNEPNIDLTAIDIDADPASKLIISECITLCIKNIKENVRQADILLITPVQMSKVSEEKIHEVSDIIASTGEELGCMVLRADNIVPISGIQEAKKLTFTRDGVHTNEEGARLIATVVADYLNEFYKK